MRIALVSCLATALLGACAVTADGGGKTAPAPLVPGYNRFFAAAESDRGHGGALLLGELGCINCHRAPVDSAGWLAAREAPVLDSVGDRVHKSYFKHFLLDPQAAKPHTLMPNVLASLPEAERDGVAEALAHFLASTGNLKTERPTPKGVALGKTVYHEVGCVACHGTRDAAGNQDKITVTSVPLGDLKTKYSLSSLAAFLENPHAVRPSGRMPGLLNNKEAKEVASYLVQGVGLDLAAANMKFSYYEGTWDNLPDFDKLTPRHSGLGPAFDLGLALRANNMALKFEGFLKIEQEGQYKFWLNSDDGSKVWIDGKLVVNNDGVHAPRTVTAGAFLSKGLHPIKVGVFNLTGGVELGLEFQGPGTPKQPVGSHILATDKPEVVKKPKDEKKGDFTIDKALVAKGRDLFASVGCANCHQLKEAGKAIASTLKPPPLPKLEGDGCLAEKPGKTGMPRYVVSTRARSDLQQAVALAKKETAPLPAKEAVHASLVRFNCYACHDRDKVGGVEEVWNTSFTTTQPEMGDEGRIPPSLTGVGAKMRPEYMKVIFTKGSDDRPYMHTRMPRFGDAHVGHLISAFASLDKLDAVPDVKFAAAMPKVKADARHMVGPLALSCIKCHTFSGNKAEGVQGIDMSVMTQRVTRDWFHHYLLDPAKLRPGTRMPTAWPSGMTLLPKILDGTARQQIEAIYVYLNDGKAALLPLGLKKQFIPLVADKEAIIYRNFIQGAGSRAIGVGYPEKWNLAFDANDLRIAMIWQGAFIDAARHWTDRGTGFEPPLGDNILAFPAGPSFTSLAKPDEAWPAKPLKESQHFKGYRLVQDGRPTFLYEVGDVRVEDFPTAEERVGAYPLLHRTLTLTADKAPDDLHFRAAVGDKITPLKDGWYEVNGAWRVRVKGAAPTIRTVAGKTELLLRVAFKGKNATLVQEIDW